MIKKLDILNGNLDLEFNEYIDFYTLEVESNVTSLDFSYEVDDNTIINIRNNNLSLSENLVYLDVISEENTLTYTFLVYKNMDNASTSNDLTSVIEIAEEESISLIKVQILSITIFILIIIIFSTIFRKRRSKNVL